MCASSSSRARTTPSAYAWDPFMLAPGAASGARCSAIVVNHDKGRASLVRRRAPRRHARVDLASSSRTRRRAAARTSSRAIRLGRREGRCSSTSTPHLNDGRVPDRRSLPGARVRPDDEHPVVRERVPARELPGYARCSARTLVALRTVRGGVIQDPPNRRTSAFWSDDADPSTPRSGRRDSPSRSATTGRSWVALRRSHGLASGARGASR